MAVLIPITSPSEFSRGPPEFPGLIAASVWMALRNGGRSRSRSVRFRPLTTPTVTLRS